MMKKYSVTIAIITILLSACCPMVSVNPLSPPDGLDKRLEGIWEPDSKEYKGLYFHIGEKSENTMVVLSVEHKENGQLAIDKIPFFLTKTRTNNYMNVRLEDVEKNVSEGNKGFIFLKYVFAGKNTLLLFPLDHQFIISAIQANKITGNITYKNKITPEGTKNDGAASEKIIDCATITDTSKNMIHFLETSKNDKLFLDVKKLIRVE